MVNDQSADHGKNDECRQAEGRGDEAGMAAGHIALAHLAIGCNAWVVWIVDVDDIGQGRDLSHQPA